MDKVNEFTQRAEELHKAAEVRCEELYGLKPWYCSVRLIENGARVVFVGANPGGGSDDMEADEYYGALTKPFEDSHYQAWLDDIHWGEGEGPTKTQENVWEAFCILFGDEGKQVLRETASFNVFASRSRHWKISVLRRGKLPASGIWTCCTIYRQTLSFALATESCRISRPGVCCDSCIWVERCQATRLGKRQSLATTN